ncbi:unnamed protein product [Sympodiomycopsis kandeliae]
MADTAGPSSSSSSSSRRETLPSLSARSSVSSSPRRAAARRSLDPHATAPPASDLITPRSSLLGKRKDVDQTQAEGMHRGGLNSFPSTISSDAITPANEAESSSSAHASAGPSRRQSRSSISAPRLSSGRKSRGSILSTDSAVAQNSTDGSRYNDRMTALNNAVDKFLELIDEAATSENFSTSLPQLSPSILDPIREEFIASLKTGIKQQHLEIVEDFNLDEKLRELQRLAEEADSRSSKPSTTEDEDESSKDIWQDELDITNSIDAKCLSVRREMVEKLEKECNETQASNFELYKQLQDNVKDADEKQRQSHEFLNALEQAVKAIQGNQQLDEQVRIQLVELSKELGPKNL